VVVGSVVVEGSSEDLLSVVGDSKKRGKHLIRSRRHLSGNALRT